MLAEQGCRSPGQKQADVLGKLYETLWNALSAADRSHRLFPDLPIYAHVLYSSGLQEEQYPGSPVAGGLGEEQRV